MVVAPALEAGCITTVEFAIQVVLQAIQALVETIQVVIESIQVVIALASITTMIKQFSLLSSFYHRL